MIELKDRTTRFFRTIKSSNTAYNYRSFLKTYFASFSGVSATSDALTSGANTMSNTLVIIVLIIGMGATLKIDKSKQKKVLVAALILSSVFVPIVFAHDLYDSVATSSYNSDISLKDNHPGNTALSGFGYSYNYTSGDVIHRVQFYLKKVGSPTGNMYAHIYLCDGSDKPTGAILSSSAGLDVSTLTTSYVLYDFYFNYTELLTMETDAYSVVIEAPTKGTIDTSNYIMCGYDTSAGDPPLLYYDNSPEGWQSPSGDSPIFYSYEYETPEPTITLESAGSAGIDNFVLFNITLDPVYYTEFSTNCTFEFKGADADQNFILLWDESSGDFTEEDDSGDYAAIHTSHEYLDAFDTLFLQFNVSLASTITSGTGNITVTHYDDDDGMVVQSFNYAMPASSWEIVAALIDSAFSFFGIAGFMTKLTAFVTGIATYFSQAISDLLSVVVQMMRLVNSVFTWGLGWLTRMITLFLNVGTYVVKILNGSQTGLGALTDLWGLIEFSTWGFDFLPLILMIEWFESLDKRHRAGQDYFTTAWSDIQVVYGLVNFFFTWIGFVVNTTVDNIMRFMDALGNV